MTNSWNERLKIAIDEDGRSKRAISLAAGLGPNYIEQTFSRGTSPVQGKLAAILDQLGQEAAIFVYTGVRANAQTIEFLNHLANAPEPLRNSALDLLQRLAGEHQPPASEGA